MKKISEKELLEIIDKKGWLFVFMNYNITEDFICKYNQNFNQDCWNAISDRSDLSLDFLRRFKDKLNWISITDKYKDIINDKFIEEFKDYICWEFIPENLNVSEDIIDRYYYKIDWNWLYELYNSPYPTINNEANKRVIKLINKYRKKMK